MVFQFFPPSHALPSPSSDNFEFALGLVGRVECHCHRRHRPRTFYFAFSSCAVFLPLTISAEYRTLGARLLAPRRGAVRRSLVAVRRQNSIRGRGSRPRQSAVGSRYRVVSRRAFPPPHFVVSSSRLTSSVRTWQLALGTWQSTLPAHGLPLAYPIANASARPSCSARKVHVVHTSSFPGS